MTDPTEAEWATFWRGVYFGILPFCILNLISSTMNYEPVGVALNGFSLLAMTYQIRGQQ